MGRMKQTKRISGLAEQEKRLCKYMAWTGCISLIILMAEIEMRLPWVQTPLQPVDDSLRQMALHLSIAGPKTA